MEYYSPRHQERFEAKKAEKALEISYKIAAYALLFVWLYVCAVVIVMLTN